MIRLDERHVQVEPGDTLSAIGAAVGVPWPQIVIANRGNLLQLEEGELVVDPDLIRPGWVLVIPQPVTPDPDPDPDPGPPADLGMSLGIYPGSFGSWDGTPNRFDRAESQLGRPVRFTTVMLDQGGPDGDYKEMAASANFLVAANRIWRYRDRVVPIVSMPLAFQRRPATGPRQTQAQALRDALDGVYDAEFAKVLNMSQSGGARHVDQYSRKALRPGWEHDGLWPAWSSREGRHELFIGVWRRVVPQFRERGWTIVWCVMESQWAQGFGPEAWPGDEYVDVVNVDHYRRENKRPSIEVLRSVARFAEDHDKEVSFVEWGFGTDTPGPDNGIIVDDGEWVDEVADFYEELGDQLYAQCIFSPPDRDVLDASEMPNVNARWRARFGAPTT